MNAVDENLYQRTVELLRPGDVDLHGAVVHTGYESEEESLLHQATLDVGDVVAEYAAAGDTYVESGNDDPEFGVNQHQGRTLEGDDFVWECQQLLREGTFDLVIYWRANDHLDDVVAEIREQGYDAVAVTEEGYRAAEA